MNAAYRFEAEYCIANGCTNIQDREGWCATHFRQSRRSGDVCTNLDCEELADYGCRGQCHVHYRQRRYASQSRPTPCLVCKRPLREHGNVDGCVPNAELSDPIDRIERALALVADDQLDEALEVLDELLGVA